MERKLLYVSFENAENKASGVNKKIFGQIKIFREYFSTDLIAVYGKEIALFREGMIQKLQLSRISPRIALCRWAARHAVDYELAYIRFQFFCPFVLKMVKRFHKAGVKTVMEIPTYPYVTELKKQGVRGIPKRTIDSFFKKACAKYIDCFAAPLYGGQILGKPCIEIRNGIDVNEVSPREYNKDKNAFHLLAVAMMAPWHGYDRMIEGLYQYYTKGGKENIIFHLVGIGSETDKYQGLIEKYSLADHVIQHGKLFGEELNNLYDIADIGIGSLGVHRTEIKKTNTLKILEYLAKGVPVICEPSEIGISQDNKYRLNIPPDESAIDIQAILDFYHHNVESSNPEITANSIRMECSKTCNIKSGLHGILDYMEK